MKRSHENQVISSAALRSVGAVECFDSHGRVKSLVLTEKQSCASGRGTYGIRPTSKKSQECTTVQLALDLSHHKSLRAWSQPVSVGCLLFYPVEGYRWDVELGCRHDLRVYLGWEGLSVEIVVCETDSMLN